MFERFHRVPEASHHVPVRDGAGLGLALVQELAEALGGSDAVESAPG